MSYILGAFALIVLLYFVLRKPSPLTQERVERLARAWWRANIPPGKTTERIAVEAYPHGAHWRADMWTISNDGTSVRVWPNGRVEEL